MELLELEELLAGMTAIMRVAVSDCKSLLMALIVGAKDWLELLMKDPIASIESMST